MTREEAKKAAEVMMAYANGKEIEFCHDGENWNLCIGDGDDLLGFDFSRFEYRIKQEPTYRPFKNKEECWNEMLKHQPFGWIMLDDMYINIVCIHQVDKRIELSPEELKFDNDVPVDIKRMFISMESAFNEYTFADGTAFGIKEEQYETLDSKNAQ